MREIMVFNGEEVGKVIFNGANISEEEDINEDWKVIIILPATIVSLTCLDTMVNKYQYMGLFMVNQ